MRNGNLLILTLKEYPETLLSQCWIFAATQNRISEVMANLELLTAAVIRIANLTLEFMMLAHTASTVEGWSYTPLLILLSGQFITGN